MRLSDSFHHSFDTLGGKTLLRCSSALRFQIARFTGRPILYPVPRRYWEDCAKAFPDSSSVLDKFQSAILWRSHIAAIVILRVGHISLAVVEHSVYFSPKASTVSGV